MQGCARIGEVGDRDLDPKPVTGLEYLTRRNQVDEVVSHRSRHGGDPNNAVDDADGPAVRPDIDELCRPIGAFCLYLLILVVNS